MFVIMGLAVGLSMLIARNNARSGQSLLHSAPPMKMDILNATDHRPHVVSLLLRCAVLVDRAGGEFLVKAGKLAPEHYGLHRRRTLDIARADDTWATFSEKEQALLLSAEGSWADGDVWRSLDYIEDVRSLRWTLGMDSGLVPLEFVELDLTPALRITTDIRTLSGNICLPPWEIRPARDNARLMLNRCMGEGLRRGFYNHDDIETKTTLSDLAGELASTPSEDLLIGAETVATASEEKIRFVTITALRRALVLDRMISYFGGDPSHIDTHFGSDLTA